MRINKYNQLLPKKFVGYQNCCTFVIPIHQNGSNITQNTAEIAQLVEHDLAKVGVASSSLVFRSPRPLRDARAFLFWVKPALQVVVGQVTYERTL